MTDTPAAVDAAPDTTSPGPEAQDSATPEYYQAEAKKAFEARDKARAEMAELKAQLDSISSAQVDAERAKAEADGDLQKQIELLAAEREKILAERDEYSSQLHGMRSDMLRTKVEQNVLGQVPDQKNHEVTRSVIDRFLSRAPDGASEEDVIRDALDEVKRVAPHFLEQPRAPQPHGFSPPDRAPTLTRAQVVREAEQRMRHGQKKLL